MIEVNDGTGADLILTSILCAELRQFASLCVEKVSFQVLSLRAPEGSHGGQISLQRLRCERFRNGEASAGVTPPQ
jgi:hypothetical protein